MLFKNISRGLLLSTILSSVFSIALIALTIYHHVKVTELLNNK